MTALKASLRHYVNTPEFKLDAVAFISLGFFPVILVLATYPIPSAWSTAEVFNLGTFCSSLCLNVGVNLYGAVIPWFFSAVLLPVGTWLFWGLGTASKLMTRGVLGLILVLFLLTSLPQSMVTRGAEIGLRFNPYLELPSLLTLLALTTYPIRFAVKKSGKIGSREVLGGLFFLYGLWTLAMTWNDVAGIAWILSSSTSKGTWPIVIGGAGLVDGILVLPSGVAIGYVVWLLYFKTRLGHFQKMWQPG